MLYKHINKRKKEYEFKMAKKKSQSEDVSLESAAEKTKETKTTLQGLLKGVSEGDGYFKVQKEEQQELISPPLPKEYLEMRLPRYTIAIILRCGVFEKRRLFKIFIR